MNTLTEQCYFIGPKRILLDQYCCTHCYHNIIILPVQHLFLGGLIPGFTAISSELIPSRRIYHAYCNVCKTDHFYPKTDPYPNSCWSFSIDIALMKSGMVEYCKLQLRRSKLRAVISSSSFCKQLRLLYKFAIIRTKPLSLHSCSQYGFKQGSTI